MRDHRDRVRALLLAEWDPIGVKDEPGAADEYDSYIEPLGSLTAHGASAEKAARYLLRTETEMMGLSGGETRAKAVAERLVEASKTN